MRSNTTKSTNVKKKVNSRGRRPCRTCDSSESSYSDPFSDSESTSDSFSSDGSDSQCTSCSSNCSCSHCNGSISHDSSASSSTSESSSSPKKPVRNLKRKSSTAEKPCTGSSSQVKKHPLSKGAVTLKTALKVEGTIKNKSITNPPVKDHTKKTMKCDQKKCASTKSGDTKSSALKLKKENKFKSGKRKNTSSYSKCKRESVSIPCSSKICRAAGSKSRKRSTSTSKPSPVNPKGKCTVGGCSSTPKFQNI